MPGEQTQTQDDVTADQHGSVSELLQGVLGGEGAADDSRDDQGADERATANRNGDQVELDGKPPEGETLDDVTKLLADSLGEDDGDAGGDDDARDKGDSLAALAEKLGVKPEEIYKLEIPMRDDGAMVTIGELKDQAGKALDLDAVSAEIDERRTTFENEMIRSKQEISDIVSMLPEIPPSLIERARAARLDIVERERSSLLDVMPGWKDDAVYNSARGEMLEAVADYGFTQQDLDNVLDHRLSKLIWDFTQYKKRIDAANARAKEIRDSMPKGGKRQSAKTRRRKSRDQATARAKSGTTGDQVAAVGNILLGGDAAG